MSLRVDRDLPLSGGASSGTELVRARSARTGGDRDVEPADGAGAVRCDWTHGSKYQSDLSGPFQAIPGVWRGAACGRAAAARTDGSRTERTAVCRMRPLYGRR